MNLADALSGSAGMGGMQWLLLAGGPYGALGRELCALLPAQNMLGPCLLRRVRFKPGRKFIAYYDVNLRVGSDETPYARPVAVTWGSHRDGDRGHATADLAEMEAEAMGRGLSAPFRKLAADSAALRMHVRISPLDVRFPQLVRMSDPEYVRDMVARACEASGMKMGHAPSTRYSVASVRYRPGKRHLLRYDPLDAPERGAIFAKLYTPKDGEQASRIAKQIGEWLSEHGEGVTSVRPFACIPETPAILYTHILGAPLTEHLQHSRETLAGSLKNSGTALYRLHQLPKAVVGPLEPFDFAAEVEEIARASEHVPALLPSMGSALWALLDRAQELHERLPYETPTFTHGDFKAKHVWITPEGLALTGFDNCRLSDPALDVGKFLANLRLWCTVFGQQDLKQVQEQFLAGYGPGASAERGLRARLYEAIELVKQSVSHLPIFEHDWEPRTQWLIGLAQVLLNDLLVSLGLPMKRISGAVTAFPPPWLPVAPSVVAALQREGENSSQKGQVSAPRGADEIAVK